MFAEIVTEKIPGSQEIGGILRYHQYAQNLTRIFCLEKGEIRN